MLKPKWNRMYYSGYEMELKVSMASRVASRIMMSTFLPWTSDCRRALWTLVAMTWSRGPEDMVQYAVQQGTEEIEFAIDGSCSKPILLELKRAGWATALLDPLGTEPLRVMYAAVPASLPQTSAMAEYLSFAFSCQAADRPTTLHADFTGTIHQFNKSEQERVQVTQKYGGVFGFAQSLPGLDHIKAVKHVKSHRSGEEYANLDAEAKRITDGNIVADHYAAEGARRHQAISPEFQERLDQQERWCKALASLVAHVMPTFDQEEERWQRNSSGYKRVKSIRTDNWHDWQDSNLGQQCTRCLRLRQPGNDQINGCTGTPKFLQDYIVNPLGHRLVAVNQKGDLSDMTCKATVFVCIKCGAWAQQRRKLKLREVCTWPTPKGLEVLSNLRKGIGPHKKLARHIDASLPLRPEAHCSRKPERMVTRVARPVPDGPYDFEQRMARLHERIREKEMARQQKEDDDNTILGHSAIMASISSSVAAASSASGARRRCRIVGKSPGVLHPPRRGAAVDGLREGGTSSASSATATSGGTGVPTWRNSHLVVRELGAASDKLPQTTVSDSSSSPHCAGRGVEHSVGQEQGVRPGDEAPQIHGGRPVRPDLEPPGGVAGAVGCPRGVLRSSPARRGGRPVVRSNLDDEEDPFDQFGQEPDLDQLEFG